MLAGFSWWKRIRDRDLAWSPCEAADRRALDPAVVLAGPSVTGGGVAWLSARE
jgi:hypothetical protein